MPMNRLFVPTLGPTDWRRLLVDPQTQWEPKHSALELAVCWESSRHLDRGIPTEVAKALDRVPELSGASLIIGFPERQVALDDLGRPSHNDLWALLRIGERLASLAVEAKAGEPFDVLVGDWLAAANSRSAKPARLAGLLDRLGIKGTPVEALRYQLLHRAVSALLEAERFRADLALMLVQSFNEEADRGSWGDFERFGRALGVEVRESEFVRVQKPTAVPLYLGWVTSEPASEARLRDAV